MLKAKTNCEKNVKKRKTSAKAKCEKTLEEKN